MRRLGFFILALSLGFPSLAGAQERGRGWDEDLNLTTPFHDLYRDQEAAPPDGYGYAGRPFEPGRRGWDEELDRLTTPFRDPFESPSGDAAARPSGGPEPAPAAPEFEPAELGPELRTPDAGFEEWFDRPD